MKTRYLKMGQIRRFCKGKKYILLTNYDGRRFGFNCNVMSMGKNKDKPDNLFTEFTGFIECDINAYISKKIPLTTPNHQN